MKINIRRLLTVAVLAAALAVAGCASVSIYRLEDGKIKDKESEGLRFYMPRPYVSVFEPFIVASEAYLARGEVSPDGTYVLVTQVPKVLQAAVNADLVEGRLATMGTLRFETAQVRMVDRINGQPNAAGVDAPAAAPAAPASAASVADAGKPEILGGLLNYKATNDNSAYAVTPQPRYFNILWLPDFDEQYVVQAKSGLGNSSVVVGLGQGWSLQALDAVVDNSSLAKPLLDFYAGTLGALQQVATAKIQGPLAAVGAVGAASAPGPQSSAVNGGRGPAAGSFAAGLPVTVKITRLRVVAPGLYPILKPKELQNVKSDAASDSRILKPVAPFTNIAFNTYDVFVVEAARAAGDSGLRVHQYVNTTLPGAAAPGVAAPAETVPLVPPAALADPLAKKARDALAVELSSPENVTTQKQYFDVDIRLENAAYVVILKKSTASKPGKAAALPDDAVLKTKVIDFLKGQGIAVDSQAIRIER